MGHWCQWRHRLFTMVHWPVCVDDYQEGKLGLPVPPTGAAIHKATGGFPKELFRNAFSVWFGGLCWRWKADLNSEMRVLGYTDIISWWRGISFSFHSLRVYLLQALLPYSVVRVKQLHLIGKIVSKLGNNLGIISVLQLNVMMPHCLFIYKGPSIIYVRTKEGWGKVGVGVKPNA